ncbi:MAG: hypothetical protein KDA28_08525, partial [Phycisphaerales bacterium]|nr:hypothetical protein [Phycisphaerales bacterium]
MKARIRVAYLKALLIFTGAVACCALVLWFGFRTGAVDLSLIALGLIFAGYAIGTRTLACQYKDVSTILLVFWGASFGFWYPTWEGEVERACLSWVQDQWGLSEDGALNLVTPIAIASSGLATAALLSITTMSTAVFIQAIMLSVVATLASLAPEYNDEATAGGILLW